jgi:hypothetical protein
MEKIYKPYSKTFEFVTFYREDLEHIYEELIRIFKKVKLAISYKDYSISINTISELDQVTDEKIESFSFTVADPSFRISIRDFGVLMDSDRLDSKSELARNNLEKYIQDHSKRFLVYLYNHNLKVIVSFSILGLISYILYHSFDLHLFGWIFLVLLVFYLADVIYSFSMLFRRNTHVYIKYKKQLPSFLKRNWDSILINLFFFILGIVATVLTQQYLLPK